MCSLRVEGWGGAEGNWWIRINPVVILILIAIVNRDF
ncbi:hypothetical protein BofuT4_uP094740.1 [Botrytis cinerea T4]|uniref:Uncharacterized protein n=1 Tax=Botryotinia fuckeliana (strain T4) TaxID=999810 RepID=G2YDB8_BOTF4|nr:hypothetical protein BofuT4_uP094740.1 [Botrytis cinerea T4]